jgi:hypothetical protein
MVGMKSIKAYFFDKSKRDRNTNMQHAANTANRKISENICIIFCNRLIQN